MIKPVENKSAPQAAEESPGKDKAPRPEGVREFEKHTRTAKSEPKTDATEQSQGKGKVSEMPTKEVKPEEQHKMLDTAAEESGLKKLAQADDGKDFHDVAGKVLGYETVDPKDKGASKEDIKTFENAEKLRNNIASSDWKGAGIDIATTDAKHLQGRSAAFQGGDSADGADDRILLSDKAVLDSKTASEGINAEMFHAFERIVHDGERGDVQMVDDEVAFGKKGTAIDEGELGKLAVEQYTKEGRVNVKALAQDAIVARDDTFSADGISANRVELEGQAPHGARRLPGLAARDNIDLEEDLTQAITSVHNLTNFQPQGTGASDGMAAMLDNAAKFPDKLVDFANNAKVVAHRLDLAQDVRIDIGDRNRELLKEYTATIDTNFQNMSNTIVQQMKDVTAGVAGSERKLEREHEIRNLAIAGAALGGISAVLGADAAGAAIVDEVFSNEKTLESTAEISSTATSATLGLASSGVASAQAARIHQLWEDSIETKFGGGESDPNNLQTQAVADATEGLGVIMAHSKLLTGDTKGDAAVKSMGLGAQTLEAGAEHTSMVANLSRVDQAREQKEFQQIIQNMRSVGFDVTDHTHDGDNSWTSFLKPAVSVTNTSKTKAQIHQDPASAPMKAGLLQIPNDKQAYDGHGLTFLDDFNWVDNSIILGDLANRANAAHKQRIADAGPPPAGAVVEK